MWVSLCPYCRLWAYAYYTICSCTCQMASYAITQWLIKHDHEQQQMFCNMPSWGTAQQSIVQSECYLISSTSSSARAAYVLFFPISPWQSQCDPFEKWHWLLSKSSYAPLAPYSRSSWMNVRHCSNKIKLRTIEDVVCLMSAELCKKFNFAGVLKHQTPKHRNRTRKSIANKPTHQLVHLSLRRGWHARHVSLLCARSWNEKSKNPTLLPAHLLMLTP